MLSGNNLRLICKNRFCPKEAANIIFIIQVRELERLQLFIVWKKSTKITYYPLDKGKKKDRQAEKHGEAAAIIRFGSFVLQF